MRAFEKIKNTVSIFIISLLFSLPVLAADLLVVADVDDTIKISHVLSTWDSLMNAKKTGNHFRGMSEVLNAVKKDQTTAVVFAYVSNAPKNLMQTSHSKFLAENKFPTGALYTRGSLSADQHKLVTIQKLITDNEPNYVVLLGDNGESDPKFYAQIVAQNPSIKFLTLIHQVYSSKKGAPDQGSTLFPGQIGFVSSVDVAEDFLAGNLIEGKSFDQFIRTVAPKILAEKLTESVGTLAFPKWMICSDSISLIDSLGAPADVTTLVDQYRALKAKRCKK